MWPSAKPSKWSRRGQSRGYPVFDDMRALTTTPANTTPSRPLQMPRASTYLCRRYLDSVVVKKTPADAAGITTEDRNKRKTIIQNSSLYLITTVQRM